MSLIYEPSGKAREYSPLAMNLYSGCGHKCSYCYVPNVLRIDRKDFDTNVNPKKNIVEKLENEIKKYSYSKLQVFMSFTTDPYNPLDETEKLTRKALEFFYKYKVPVSILTKSGLKALRDLDIIKKFGEHIKIGTSLTYDNPKDSNRIEAGAAVPDERLEMLKTFHSEKVKTWVSFEPILKPDQVLNLLKQSLNYVDEYQFGKLANDTRVFDWTKFLTKVVTILRSNKSEFYIKDTLRESANIELLPAEYDLDRLTLKPFTKYTENTLF